MYEAKPPIISIITVVKDDLRGFQRTYKSIALQNIQNFEWLIIDGKSTDGTYEFASGNSSDKNWKILSLEPKGIYNAMNFASGVAEGEWLWFINAGDFLINSEVIEQVHLFIKANPEVNAVASSVVHVTSTGFLYDVSVPEIISLGDYKVAAVNHQGMIVRKTHFDSIGGFDENLSLAADGKFLDSLARAENIYIIDDVWVAFTLGGRSGLNYAETIRQTQTYRPNNLKDPSFQQHPIKNMFRLLLLWCGNVFLLRYFANYYFSLRQIRILKSDNLGLVIENRFKLQPGIFSKFMKP